VLLKFGFISIRGTAKNASDKEDKKRFQGLSYTLSMSSHLYSGLNRAYFSRGVLCYYICNFRSV